jgi:hypothetical protein
MKCNYCNVEELKTQYHKDIAHPTITIKYQGLEKTVYICPSCASQKSIGDLLVQIGLELAQERKG